jgi:hypothetical protein
VNRVSIISSQDVIQWHRLLPANRSVFGSPEFCAIWEKHHNSKAHLGIWPDSNPQVVYPFFLKPLPAHPYFRDTVSEFTDLSTPEFTGPTLVGQQYAGAPNEFGQSFSAWCSNNKVISEFAHLNPWGEFDGILDGSGIVYNREVVFVDLTLTEEEIWNSSFIHACRQNIRRALSEGVTIVKGESADDIAEFHRIYDETMRRREASSRHCFPESFFRDFLVDLPENSMFLLARKDTRTIAAILYLFDGENIYSYLGGADLEFQKCRPTNALHFEAIKWGITHGKKRLILGGGFRPNDGIFRFKCGFSPLTAKFYTYRRVHMQDIYDRLCQDWMREHGQPKTVEGYSHFPLYRMSV